MERSPALAGFPRGRPRTDARRSLGILQPGVRAHRRARGIALILVLWVLTLLTVMALAMTAAQRTEIALTENQLDDARFRALADGAIAFMALSFLMPAPQVEDTGIGADPLAAEAQPWIPNGVPRTFRFAGQAVRIAVENEQSKINLNEADTALLGALLVALGVSEDAAPTLADAIADWRDEDDLKLLNGAEDDDYRAAGRALGAKDALFSSVEELQQVLGIDRTLYSRLGRELSVDSEGSSIDQEFASAAVIAALTGVSLEEAQIRVQERDSPLLPDAQAPRAVSRGGPLYRVRVTEIPGGAEPEAGVPAGGRGRVMEALVELTQGQDPPYRVRWRRFGLAAAPPSGSEADAGDGP